jgi:hypothetical protein
MRRWAASITERGGEEAPHTQGGWKAAARKEVVHGEGEMKVGKGGGGWCLLPKEGGEEARCA